MNKNHRMASLVTWFQERQYFAPELKTAGSGVYSSSKNAFNWFQDRQYFVPELKTAGSGVYSSSKYAFNWFQERQYFAPELKTAGSGVYASSKYAFNWFQERQYFAPELKTAGSGVYASSKYVFNYGSMACLYLANSAMKLSTDEKFQGITKTATKVAAGAGIVSLIPAAMGFSSVGPAAGTLATLWHASIGNAVAGSVFSGLQSVGMTTLIGFGAPAAGIMMIGLTGYIICC